MLELGACVCGSPVSLLTPISELVNRGSPARSATLTLHPEPLGATCFSVAIPIAARLDRVDAPPRAGRAAPRSPEIRNRAPDLPRRSTLPHSLHAITTRRCSMAARFP